MLELGFGNKSDFYLKKASLGLLLVCFLVEIWSDESLILRFLGLIFCWAALDYPIVEKSVKTFLGENRSVKMSVKAILMKDRSMVKSACTILSGLGQGCL